MSTPAPPAFENVTCPRCSGVERQLFKLLHGDVCGKCGGRRYVFTKRGAAAAAFYLDLLSAPVEEVRPGDKVTFPIVSLHRIWLRVTAVETTREGGTRLVYDRDERTPGYAPGGGTFAPGERIRVVRSADEKSAALASALAFQGTLTKEGTPRKQRAA